LKTGGRGLCPLLGQSKVLAVMFPKTGPSFSARKLNCFVDFQTQVLLTPIHEIKLSPRAGHGV
jgi:hypothetical protein